jgi:hypothetical protein
MRTWLFVTYKVPAEPSRTRVFLWRKLKELGAVYIQQGAAVLPMTEALLAQALSLREDTRAGGGELLVGRTEFVDAQDDARVIATFQSQRDSDYSEIIEQCERLVCELDGETANGKFTYAEIEENETELARIHRWMERIVARDWFGAPGRAAAEQAIDQAEQRSALYTAEVERRRGQEPDVPLPSSR